MTSLTMRDVSHRRPTRWESGWNATVNQDRDYDADEVEFMMAVDRWKRDHNCPHPTWPKILEIARALGYRKQEGC